MMMKSLIFLTDAGKIDAIGADHEKLQKVMKHLLKPIRHVYNWPKITIGNDLDALLYAYKNESYFISNDWYDHVFYDELKDDLTVSESLSWNKSEKLDKVCDDLAFQISFYRSKAPFGHPASIHIEPENNFIEVFFKKRVIKVLYEQLKIFSLNNISGLGFYTAPLINESRIIDFFKIHRADPKCKFNGDIIDSSSQFVHKIIPIERRKIACESIIPTNELDNIDYSPNMVRLKAKDSIKKNGFKSSKIPMSLIEQNMRLVFSNKSLNYQKYGNIEVGNEDLSVWR